MDEILELAHSGLTPEDLREPSTQQEWAQKLGVDERTIRNWQVRIIDKGEKILSAYYWAGRKTPNGEPKKKLDFYQKTLLFLISRLRGAGLSDAEIAQWFVSTTVFNGSTKKRIVVVSRNRMKEALGLW